MKTLFSVLVLLTTALGCGSANEAPLHVTKVTIIQPDPASPTCDSTLPGISRISTKAAAVGTNALATIWVANVAQAPAFGFGSDNDNGIGQNDFEVKSISYKYDGSVALSEESRAVYFIVPENADITATCFQEYLLGDTALGVLSTTTVTEPTLITTHVTMRGNYVGQTADSGAGSTIDFPITLVP